MREIKFRAWDEIENEYIYEPIEFEMRRLNRAVIIDKTWIGYHQSESFTMEQYTGLKDKNGKKIYEGDIVTFKDISAFPLDQYQNCEVVWIEHKSSFMPRDKEQNHRAGYYLHFWDQLEDIEIIGNIHEQ